MEKELDWEKASKHLTEMMAIYSEIGWPWTFWIMLMKPLLKRLTEWERTKELYEEIIGIE